MITVSQCITNAETAIRKAAGEPTPETAKVQLDSAYYWMELAKTVATLQEPPSPPVEFVKPDVEGLAS